MLQHLDYMQQSPQTVQLPACSALCFVTHSPHTKQSLVVLDWRSFRRRRVRHGRNAGAIMQSSHAVDRTRLLTQFTAGSVGAWVSTARRSVEERAANQAPNVARCGNVTIGAPEPLQGRDSPSCLFPVPSGTRATSFLSFSMFRWVGFDSMIDWFLQQKSLLGL